MNATLAAWNAADEAAALEAMIACCGAKRWAAGNGGAAPHRSSVEALSEAADRVWSTMRGAGLAGGLRMPSAHRRAQRPPHAARAIGRVVASRSNRQRARQRERVLAELAEENAALRAALRLHVHRVRNRQERRRDAGDSQAPPGERSRDRIARSRRTAAADHANPFGKVVESNEQQLSTHVLDTVLGKPAAGIAVRLEKFAGGGWIEISRSASRRTRA